MEICPTKARVARFGLFEADFERRSLTKGGLRVRLQDQPFQVLALLLERPGELVTREDLRQKLWSADTFVEFDRSLNTAIGKLRTALGDSADNPRFIETVPRRGYRFLAPVNFPIPAAATGEPKTSENLSSDIVVAAREQSRIVIEGTSRSPFWLVAILVAGVIVSLGAALYFYRANSTRAKSAESASTQIVAIARPSVAVMGFRNLSPQAEQLWLSTALAEMLNTELGAGGKLRTIPGEQISRAKLDLSLADTEALAKDSLARIRTNIGADYVVLGSYTALEDKDRKHIRLDLRIQDTRAGETIAEEAVRGTQEELFDLVSEAGSRLRERLNAGGMGAEDAVQVRASMPSNVTAARLYSEGLAKLRVFDARAGRDLVTQAVAADPAFPLAHSALASAWTMLGYASKAQREAKLAFDLAAPLPPEERLLIEGRYREANREWQRAVEVYRILWHDFPDNLDYGLRLASVQSSAGQGNDALKTIQSLRGLPLGLAADPRIDLEESRTAEMMGDFRRSQQAASAAAAKGRAQGSRLIVAQARSDEGWDWDRLGDFDKAAAALNEARTLYTDAGDRQSTAVAINLVGDTQYDKGDFESAQKTLNQAYAMCRQYGFQKCAARSLNAIGHIQKDQGHLALAKTSYEEVLRITRETDVRAGVAAALSNIGNVLQDMGDLSSARKRQEESLQAFTEVSDKRGMGATLSNLGNLLDDLGDLSRAVQCYERAYKLDQETGYKRGFGFVLSGWGRVLMEQDRLPEARAKLEESLKIRKEIGSPDMIGDSLLALANLSLEESRPAQAEQLARDADAQFSTVKDIDSETSANAILARALLTEQKLSDAGAAAKHAASFKSKAFDQRFDSAIASAIVTSANGHVADSEKQLTAIMNEAKRLNFAGYELLARLELCRIQKKSGNSPKPEAFVLSLEKDARERGFLLIARQAMAVRQSR